MKSNGFDKRLKQAVEFEEELRRILQCRPRVRAIAVNGTEHTHPSFVELLRTNTTDGARYVRYAPDGVYLCTNGDVIHYDAKASKAIEKDAYRTYMDYVRAGCKVMLFVKWGGMIYWQYVDKVVLTHGSDTVNQFPIGRRFPVDEDGWICPRHAEQKKPVSANMSGTPYREIDFSSMNALELSVIPQTANVG